MTILDVFSFMLFFLIALTVIAVVLMTVYEKGRRDGAELGAERERAFSWERVARARESVEAMGAPRVAEPGAEWELPE